MMRVAWLLGLFAAGCGATLDDPTQRGTDGGNGNGNGNGSGGHGGGSGSGSGSGSDLTATEFLSEYAMADCTEAFACRASFPGTDSDFAQTWGSSAQQCSGLYLVDLMPAQAELGIANGTITYSANAAASCLASIAFGSCNEYWNNGPMLGDACNHVFEGTLEYGASCDVDYACKSQSCDLSANVCS